MLDDKKHRSKSIKKNNKTTLTLDYRKCNVETTLLKQWPNKQKTELDIFMNRS